MEPQSSSDVIAALAQAFPARPIDPELAFAGTVYLDADRFKAGVRGRSWPELAQDFLEFHHDALSFLAPAAFAELVPAYLAAALAPGAAIDVMPVSLLGTLTRSEDTGAMFDRRVALLLPEQQLAVARAVDHLATTLDEGLWKRSARRALASHWRQLLNRRMT